MYRIIEPVMDETVRDLCRRPYFGHPKGCPNYGKKKGCPPAEKLLPEILNLSQPVMAVWVDFNFILHKEMMQKKHPSWSQKQITCCLYWQGHVNAELKRLVSNICTMLLLYNELPYKNIIALYCPEATGVNVTATMKGIGIELEWPPEKIVRKIAFIGCPKSTNAEL